MGLIYLRWSNSPLFHDKIYVRHTGKELSYIEDNMERDKFMSPKEAMEFGLVDRILEHPPRQESIRNFWIMFVEYAVLIIFVAASFTQALAFTGIFNS